MISVVVPCFNAEPFLATALDSILAQLRPADEIIVVDDCSTDRSAAVAANFPVQVLRTAANSGHATARNLAIEHARGDLIAWLDADDFWEPAHLETVAGLLERFPAAQVAFSRVRLVGTRQGEWPGSPCERQPRNVFWDCFARTIVPAMTAVTRRAVLQEAGGFDPAIRVAPDFDLWLRISRHHLFVSDPSVTANYRWHPRQISTRQFAQIRSMYESRARFLERARQTGDQPLEREVERELLALWKRQLAKAWRTGAAHDLQDLLSLAPLIPRASGAARRWQLKAMIPGSVVRGAAALLRPLRRAWTAKKSP